MQLESVPGTTQNIKPAAVHDQKALPLSALTAANGLYWGI